MLKEPYSLFYKIDSQPVCIYLLEDIICIGN